MIELKNVSKVYDGLKIPVKALNNVNLTLEDKGLTFILGKSGSGKSTLLNLIGLLDKPTNGSILYANYDYENLTEMEKDYLRNNQIGFVFQNFNLINEFTVYDNLAIILDLQDDNEKDLRINEVLKLVELEGYEDRKPLELSAGQQQRIAIASALIKKPKVLLADEPTGNVDSKTAKVILDLFKKISKDILVVIVSHNESDSIIYSDRLIELADGEIIKDLKRVENYKNDLVITNKEVILPYHRELTGEELKTLNEHNLDNKAIIQNNSGFVDFIVKETNNEPLNFQKQKMNSSFKYSYKLYKNRFLTNILTNFILAFIVSVIIVATFFFNFSIKDKFQAEIEKSDLPTIIFNDNYNKHSTNKTLDYLPITDDVINDIKSTGTTVYPIYNISGFLQKREYPRPTNNLFGSYLVGLAVVDLDYLTTTFGNEDNELEFLYYNMDHPVSMYVTDFWLDAYLTRNNSAPRPINQTIVTIERNFPVKIGAVIKTDYKTKYEAYFEEDGTIVDNLDSEQLNYLYDEVFYKYNIRYSTNPNFVDEYVNFFTTDYTYRSPNNYSDFKISKGIITQGNNKHEATNTIIRFIDEPKMTNKALLTLNQFNIVFGTNYKKRTDINVENYQNIPFEMEVHLFENDKQYVIKDTFTLERLGMAEESDIFYISSQTKHFVEMIFDTYALLIPPSSSTNYLNKLDEHNLIIFNSIISIYNAVEGVINSFTGVFNYIRIILAFTTLIIIIVLAINTSKRNNKFIGVMKCFGARRYDLTKLFFIQTLFNIIVMSIFITGGAIIGTHLANNIVEKGISHFIKFDIRGLHIINISWPTVINYILTSMIIFLLSVIVPIVKIKNVNPIEIVKSKE